MSNEARWPNLTFNYENEGRPELIDAVEQTVRAYKKGEACIGHCFPPRSGKTTIIRAAAIELKEAGATFVYVLMPWKTLAKQVHKPKSVLAQLESSPSNWSGPYRGNNISRISTSQFWKTTKETTLVSSTLHLAHSNIQYIRAALDAIKESGGKRAVVMVDEVHLVGEDKKWWDTIEDFIEKGAFVVTFTGTPGRVDGKLIPGFRPEIIGEEKTHKRTITLARSPIYTNKDDKLVRLCTKKDVVDTSQDVNFVATGVNFPYSQAFEREWVQRCHVEPVEFDVRDPATDMLAPLSSIPPGVAATHLGRWLRSGECCRATAVKAVEHLNDWRRQYPNAKMLVITTFDRDTEIEGGDASYEDAKSCNAHAREIRRAIVDAIAEIGAEPGCVLSLDDISIEICTSKLDNGEADENAANKLDRFALTTTDKDGNKPIDILIVKNMGVVGLDVPECKVLLDVSQVRRGPLKAQLAFRPLSRWKLGDEFVNKDAVIIYPQDQYNQDFYQALKDIAGVTRINNRLDEGEDYEDETLVAEVEPPLDIVPGSGRVEMVGDESGRWVSGDKLEVVKFIRDTYAVARSARTADIIDSIEAGAFGTLEQLKERAAQSSKETAATKPMVENISDDLENEKKEGVDEITSKVAEEYVKYTDDPETYVRLKKKLTNNAKKYCGVSPAISMGDIHDPEQIRCIKSAIYLVKEATAREVFKNRG